MCVVWWRNVMGRNTMNISGVIAAAPSRLFPFFFSSSPVSKWTLFPACGGQIPTVSVSRWQSSRCLVAADKAKTYVDRKVKHDLSQRFQHSAVLLKEHGWLNENHFGKRTWPTATRGRTRHVCVCLRIFPNATGIVILYVGRNSACS